MFRALVPSARRHMGRNRKWVLQDVQEAVWRTILRGPCPPSHRWPLAQKSQNKSNQPRPNESAVRQRGPAGQQPATPSRFSPVSTDCRHSAQRDTRGHVRCLEEVVGALGEESPHAKPLLTALKAAKANSTSPCVQIESTTQYLERARKRLAQAVKQPSGGWSGCKIQRRLRCNRSPRSWFSCKVASTS